MITIALLMLVSAVACNGMRCDGQDNGCCTKDTPCNKGEGDCDYDYECAGSLVCGSHNCPWGDGDSCCEARCTGQDDGCCTKDTPCSIGEGDCDHDYECADSLVCGSHNCPWGDGDSCCEGMRCDGQDDGCCTKDTPCKKGEGDCDHDYECAGSLVCGSHNCPWGDGDSCCEGVRCNGQDHGCCTKYTPCNKGEGNCDSDHGCAGSLVCDKLSCAWSDSDFCCKGMRCNGQNNGCCTKETPCNIGEGDCDYDYECAGSLVCGHLNCVWGNGDSCCQATTTQAPPTPEAGPRCNGQDNGCCTKDTPCNIGEGDCDNDHECAGQLVCVSDNCPWGDSDDCCQVKKPTCNVIADVGFILDSSGSLSGSYQLEKDFLKSVAAAFGISKDGPRASVVTFSLTAELSIKFNDYFDMTSFDDAVDAIPLMGRNTRIDKALRLAQKGMFRIQNGARVNSPKILVLLTDGSQTTGVGEENLEVISNELRRHGIFIIVVGIGDGINHAELAQIAGSTDKVFTAASFDELVSKEFIKTLTDKSCKLASTKKDEEMH